MTYSEHQHQVAVAQYLDLLANTGILTWCHVPNERGGKCPKCKTPIGAAARRRLAEEGVKPGVSDCIILFRGGQMAALELKVQGRKPSDAQSAFLATVKAMGGWSAWSGTIEESMAIIDGWVKQVRSTQRQG